MTHHDINYNKWYTLNPETSCKIPGVVDRQPCMAQGWMGYTRTCVRPELMRVGPFVWPSGVRTNI